MNISQVGFLFIAVFLTASPLMAQMDDQQSISVTNNEEKLTNDEASMQEDEGYDDTDQEYNEAEVNAEIPDEYFNDDVLANDDLEPAAENVDSTVSNVETAQ